MPADGLKKGSASVAGGRERERQERKQEAGGSWEPCRVGSVSPRPLAFTRSTGRPQENSERRIRVSAARLALAWRTEGSRGAAGRLSPIIQGGNWGGPDQVSDHNRYCPFS